MSARESLGAVPPTSTLLTVEKLNDVTDLVKECAAFVDSAKSNLNIPFAAFERVRQWRVKRRESRAMEVIDTLLPRIREVEASLRLTIQDTAERKAALREQAKFLLARLSSCIAYNQDNLDCLVPIVEDTRSVVISLSDALVTVKRMISFNNELLRLRNVQTATTRRPQGNNYNRSLTNNIAMFRPVSEDDLNRDGEYVPLLARLNSLREIREKYVTLLAQLLESREMYTVNHENCNACFKQICQLLRLDKQPTMVPHPTRAVSSKTDVDANEVAEPAPASPTTTPVKRLSLVLQSVVGLVPGGSPHATPDDETPATELVAQRHDAEGNPCLIIGDEVIAVYSHADTCSDCTCVVTITNDCIISFEEIHNIQVLATRQQSSLIEVRERINEVIESVTPAATPGSTPQREGEGEDSEGSPAATPGSTPQREGEGEDSEGSPAKLMSMSGDGVGVDLGGDLSAEVVGETEVETEVEATGPMDESVVDSE